MSNRTSKTLGVKMVGSGQAAQSCTILPGTPAADILASLGLGAGFQLSDAQAPEVVFQPTDVVYPRVEDGALLYCSSTLDAGR